MSLEGNQNIVKSEQGRLDKIDTKIDKKVVLSGKDYSNIVFNKVDTTIAKVNTDFGIKNEAILKDQNYQNMKTKALNGITQTLFKLDEKNISELAGKLDKLLTAIEQGGEKMSTLDASLNSSDKLAQQLKSLKEKGDIDGMVKATKEYMTANEQTLNDAQKVDLLNQLNGQLLAQSEQLRKGEIMNVKGVEWRLGDTIVASRLNMDENGIHHEIHEIAKVEKIDTAQGVMLREGATTKTIPLTNFEEYLDTGLAIQNQYGKEKNPFALGNERRIIATQSPSDTLAKEAQEMQQKAALIALKDLVVKGSALASCKDFTPKSPRTFALIRDKNIAIDTNTGAVNFDKTFDNCSIEDQQIVVDELVQFLKGKGAEQKVEDAKSPEEKLFYQAELSLQKGNISEARGDCIKFMQSLNGKELTPDLLPLKEKAEGYLKGMWQHSMNELKQANETMFGKAAREQVRDKMKYGMLKGDSQQMKRFEEAFQAVHNQANERIEAASQDSKTENILQDPSSIFKDLPQPSGENAKEITACQDAWQKIAFAQTMDMRNNSSAQKQENYADAADALRALGLYDFSEDFVKKGLRDRLDINKNSDTLKAKKQECVMRLNSHREEYATRVKKQFLEQTLNLSGRPELSEKQFNNMIDQAIDRAADQQIDAALLKSAVTQMDEGGLKGSDARLAQIYKNIENPNENLLSFGDKEIDALGDKVIHFAAEMAVQAALMAVTGGIGNIATAGVRTALMSAGAREAIAGAAGFMANAAAFEVATKVLSPYVTGGPGFTTAEDFALDYGKSLLMFGALHGLGKFAGAASKEASATQVASLGQKATIYTAQLGTEVAVLAGLSELEAARDGKLTSMNGVHLLGENVAAVLGLRAGTKLVHASGLNEGFAKATEATAKVVGKTGKNFAEGASNVVELKTEKTAQVPESTPSKISTAKLNQTIEGPLTKSSEFKVNDRPLGETIKPPAKTDPRSYAQTIEEIIKDPKKQQELGIKPEDLPVVIRFHEYIKNLEGKVQTLRDEALQARGVLDSIIDDIALKSDIAEGGKMNNVPIKGMPRIMEKVIDSTSEGYNGNISQLRDLARGTIVFKSFEDIPHALETLQSDPRVSKLYVKNNIGDAYGKTPHPAGYRDVNITMEVISNGKPHVVELQLHVKEMIEAKEKGRPVDPAKIADLGFTTHDQEMVRKLDPKLQIVREGNIVKGHELYEIWRKIGENDPMDMQILKKKLENLMQKVYNDAWQDVLKKHDSKPALKKAA